MLRYSDTGLAARPAFFAPYNDITIIVEDKDKENFYTEVMNQLFQGVLSITKVLGVGGKREVLNRLAERGGNSQRWREFYIVDGDFDELLGLTTPDSIYFYRLRQYDIESYLVEETAICRIAEEERPRASAAEYRDLFHIQSWVGSIVDASLRLAACAALLQKLDETQTGISQSIEMYVSQNPILPDELQIESHIGRVRSSQSIVARQRFDHLLEEMISRMGASSHERMRWVSGKDILIPLVIRLLRTQVRRSLSKESVCFRLARNCEFNDLGELRDRILRVALPITR